MAQGSAIRSYCKAQGWELIEIYEDAGRSGKSLQGREALNRLLDDSKDGAFQRIVFLKLDRLGRNLKDLLTICDSLEASGVGIVSISESIDTGTATGRMIRSILGAVSEFEREAIVERIKVGIAEKARQGEIVGPLPLGYARSEDGEVVVDGAGGALIRTAFERYSTGAYSMRDMAAWAADVGLRSTEGNPLDRLSVRKLLSNVTYTGVVTYHGSVVGKGNHPAIVDAALFSTVQKIMQGRQYRISPKRPFGREPYPLSGVATCDACGTPLVGVSVNVDRRYRYTYYRCSTTHRQGRGACTQRMVRSPVLENQIADYIGGMKLPAEYLGEVVAELRSRRHEDHEGEIRSLKNQIERWRKLFVMGEVDEATLKAETVPLKKRLAEIDRPNEVLDVEGAVNYLRDVGSLWADSPRQLQREFVREVFDRIGIEGKQVTAITPKLQYAPLFVLDRRERYGQVGPEFCSLAPRARLELAT